ncbi:MAG: signal peptidase I [Sedimentisphaerales bacterium]|nr:signal peptidase I [Sedimentisphaerales bacterium]
MEKNRDHPKEPWFAVILSSFFFGIGQIYTGRIRRGGFLILTEGLLSGLLVWSILSPTCDILFGAGLYLVLEAIWIWNLYDAYRCARRPNPEHFEIERKHSKDAWLAFFLSDLIPGLGQIYLKKWLTGIGFVITAGILLIVDLKYPLLDDGLWAVFSVLVCYLAYRSAPIRRESSNKPIISIVIFILCLHLLYGYSRPAFRAYVVEAFVLPTEGMKPTLVPGDRILVRKSGKYIASRGDVITFKSLNDPNIPYIKRIAALSGEIVEIKDEILYIDGQKVQLPALQGIEYPPRDFLGMEGEPYEVPEDHVFVIGDNSVNSWDSRAFGAVPLGDVIGKAYKIYWPLSRRGPIK